MIYALYYFLHQILSFKEPFVGWLISNTVIVISGTYFLFQILGGDK